MEEPRETLEGAKAAVARLTHGENPSSLTRVNRALRRLPTARALRPEMYDETLDLLAAALRASRDSRVHRPALELALRATIARELARARRQLGSTLSDVAQRAYLDTTSLQQIEVGRTYPRSRSLIVTLGRVLGLSPTWFDDSVRETVGQLTKRDAPDAKDMEHELSDLAARWQHAPDQRQGSELRQSLLAEGTSARETQLPRDPHQALRALSDLEPALDPSDTRWLLDELARVLDEVRKRVKRNTVSFAPDDPE